MEFLKLETLTLNTFDKNNIEDLNFLKKLCSDKSIKTRFQGLMNGLVNNPKLELFNHSFFVKHNYELIGYINIGSYNELEKCIYLRAAIDKDKRGLSYGKTLLAEISEYIFLEYQNVYSIKLKIAPDNIPSLMTANSCGYEWLNDDFYIKNNPYINIQKNLQLTKKED